MPLFLTFKSHTYDFFLELVRSSLCSSQGSQDSTEVILKSDELAEDFAEYNDDQICGMSPPNMDGEPDIGRHPECHPECQLKPFEEFEDDEEDDSIDKDVTIDEYIEDDFRHGFI